MSEYLQRFIDWTKLKIRLHKSDDIKFYFKEREIWYASLGENIGFEENGKNDRFERPILVLKKFNKNLLWVLPLTSKAKEGNYHFQFTFEGALSSVILPQIRAISSKRLIRKMGFVPIDIFDKIRGKIKDFL